MKGDASYRFSVSRAFRENLSGAASHPIPRIILLGGVYLRAERPDLGIAEVPEHAKIRRGREKGEEEKEDLEKNFGGSPSQQRRGISVPRHAAKWRDFAGTRCDVAAR